MSNITISKDIQQTHDRIVDGDPAISWAVYSYDSQDQLKVHNFGDDLTDEFADEFSDGKLQYAFMRIKDPNSQLPKLVLVGWCGEGAPRKGVFQQHFASISRQLSGYHVQLTARSSEDLAIDVIQKKVEDSSGAKYSTAGKASLFGPTTSRKPPTTNSLVNQLKGQATPSFDPRRPMPSKPRLPSSAGASPVSTRTMASTTNRVMPTASNSAAEDWEQRNIASAKNRTMPEPTQEKEAPIKSAYTPIGRPDINALRAQSKPPARQAEDSTSSIGSADTASIPPSASLASRMSAFTSATSTNEGNVTRSSHSSSNPLASRFGTPSLSTKPAVPSQMQRESKAIGGLSKNFGAEDGKSPAQLWAERKARERGEPVIEAKRDAPVKATTYGDSDQAESAVAGLTSRLESSKLEQPQAPVVPMPVIPLNRPNLTRPRSPSPELVDEEHPNPAEEIQVGTDNGAEEREEEREQQITSAETTRKVSDERASPMPPQLNLSTRPSIAPMATASVPSSRTHDADSIMAQQATNQEEQPASDFKAKLAQSLGVQGQSSTPSSAGTPSAGGARSKPRAKAIYDYEPQEENELSFQEGDVITDIDMVDDGWWSGSCHNVEGLFPSNYVEMQSVDGNPESVQGVESPALEHRFGDTNISEEAQNSAGPSAIALYDYEAAEEGELSFVEGDRIIEVDQVDEGWWKGMCHGQEGLFPANYVELE